MATFTIRNILTAAAVGVLILGGIYLDQSGAGDSTAASASTAGGVISVDVWEHAYGYTSGHSTMPGAWRATHPRIGSEVGIDHSWGSSQ